MYVKFKVSLTDPHQKTDFVIQNPSIWLVSIHKLKNRKASKFISKNDHMYKGKSPLTPAPHILKNLVMPCHRTRSAEETSHSCIVRNQVAQNCCPTSTSFTYPSQKINRISTPGCNTKPSHLTILKCTTQPKHRKDIPQHDTLRNSQITHNRRRSKHRQFMKYDK